MATTIKGSGPQLSEDDVAKLEAEIGARLPPQYRAFLLAHNGGGPDVDIGPRGRGCTIVALSCRGLPASVCQGNLFLVGLSDVNADHVFFWSHNDEGEAPSYENVTLVAESFEAGRGQSCPSRVGH